MAEFGTVEYYEGLLRDNGKSHVTLKLAHQLASFAVTENANGNEQQENEWFQNLDVAYKKVTEPVVEIAEEQAEPSKFVTLRQKCNDIYENSKGGHYSIPAYYKPIVPDDIADQVDDWYTIGMVDSLWILRASDIPKGIDYSYVELLPKLMVSMRLKGGEQYYKEEDYHRISGYAELEEEQKSLFSSTFDRHLKARGTEKQKEYAAYNLKEIKWDAAENCLKVYYKNGDWWHYDMAGEWY
jgi:hypothetical protein